MSTEIDWPEWQEFIPYGASWWDWLIDTAKKWPVTNYRRWNDILNLAMFRCEGKGIAYVRTAVEPAGSLVMAFLSVEPDDLLRGWLKGSGYRSRIKMFGSPRKSKRHYEVPEIGEEIGRRLPMAGKGRGTRLGKGLKWLFQLDGIIQQGLLYFVLYDELTEFLSNWSIGILRLPECNESGVLTRGGEYAGYGGDYIGQVPFDGGFSEVVRQCTEDENVCIAASHIVADRPVRLTNSLKLRPLFPPETNFFYRTWWENDTGEKVWGSFPQDTRWGVDSDSTTATGLLPPGSYKLMYQIWESDCYLMSLDHYFTMAQ